jgi:hypothetical protein
MKGEKKHGPGIQIWPDGARFEGEWLLGHATGKGRFWHSNGDYYEG